MSRLCSSCGVPLLPEAVFCSDCGTMSPKSTPSTAPPPLAPPSVGPSRSPMPPPSVGPARPATPRPSTPTPPPTPRSAYVSPPAETSFQRAVRPGGWFWWAWKIDRALRMIWFLTIVFVGGGLTWWGTFKQRDTSPPVFASPTATVTAPDTTEPPTPSEAQAQSVVPAMNTPAPARSMQSQEVAIYMEKFGQNMKSVVQLTSELNTYMNGIGEREWPKDDRLFSLLLGFHQELVLFGSRFQQVTNPFFQQSCPPPCQKLRDLYHDAIQAEMAYVQQQSDAIQQITQNPASADRFVDAERAQRSQMMDRMEQQFRQIDTEMERLAKQYL